MPHMYANAYNSSQPARKASGCKICLIRLTCLYLSLVGLIGLIIIIIGRYLAFLGGLIGPCFQYARKGLKKMDRPPIISCKKMHFLA